MPRGVEIDAITRARFHDAARKLGDDIDAVARRAGISRRVVREVFSGHRTRVSEKTMRRLERALLGTGAPVGAAAPPRKRPARGVIVRRVALAAAAAVVLLAAWRIAHRPLAASAIVACRDRTVGARDARSGRVLWDSTLSARASFAFVAPWRNASSLIYGTMNDGSEGGRLCARDLASGRLLWFQTIPREDAARHFPARVADSGVFVPFSTCTGPYDCNRVCTADFDGDGAPDLAVRWVFEPWYPACVTWFSQSSDDPARVVERGRYYTCGAISSVTLHDIDGDGRAGIAIASTNNASGYQGAMVTFLDAAHWTGGSVDSVSVRSHWRNPPGLTDGSLARVVFPSFDDEFMAAFGSQRLDVGYVEFRGDTLVVAIGQSRAPVAIVRMNTCFEVIDIRPAAGAVSEFGAAPEALKRRFLDGYLAEWVARRVHFGACLR